MLHVFGVAYAVGPEEPKKVSVLAESDARARATVEKQFPGARIFAVVTQFEAIDLVDAGAEEPAAPKPAPAKGKK